MSTDEIIKPCPFCGAAPEWTHVILPNGRGTVSLQCMNDNCTTNPCTELFSTRQEAIKAWNPRHESKVIIEGQDIALLARKAIDYENRPTRVSYGEQA